MPEPIVRHKALQPLSRDHHHGLLLCWKIRQGFRRNIEISRMKRYASWFWRNHLLPHFEAEEKYIFVLLDNENELVKKALVDHRRLKRLFEEEFDDLKSLSLIEEELESHIRFEEKILFDAIQKTATAAQLAGLEENLYKPANCEAWKDEFWK